MNFLNILKMLRIFLASKAVIKVCTKIYKKSFFTVSTAVDKRRSVKFENSPATFTGENLRGMKSLWRNLVPIDDRRMKEGDSLPPSEQQGVPNGHSELQKSWTGKADLKEELVNFSALFVETREF